MQMWLKRDCVILSNTVKICGNKHAYLIVKICDKKA